MKFICENCGKNFDQYEECKNHENSCMTNKTQYIYLKYIVVYPELDNNDVHIYEHPTAFKVKENYYILNENSFMYNCSKYEPEFDTIRVTDNGPHHAFYIVTESRDLIYEDECIAKLIDYKLNKAKEEYEEFGEAITNFSTNKYSVTRKMI